MKKQQLLVVCSTLAILLLLAGCLPNQWGNWRVSEATVRDYLFAVEKRDNGITTVWLRNDESGVYCFTSDVATYASLTDMLRSDKMVTMEYADARLFNASPCHGAETSYEGSGFHTFIVKSIEQGKSSTLDSN